MSALLASRLDVGPSATDSCNVTCRITSIGAGSTNSSFCKIPPIYLRETGRFARSIAAFPADTPGAQEPMIEAMMERTICDLLEEAVAVGAIDLWTDEGVHFEFHAGSRTFRVRRIDGAGILTALINRRHTELLRAH